MTMRQNESPIDTRPRANAQQIALALGFLGVKKIEVEGSVIIATHNKVTVNIRLCRENIPLVCWTDEDGEYHIGNSVLCAMKALSLTGYIRPSTVITRALASVGMSNRRSKTSASRDFYVHGEYNDSHERIRTVVDFYGSQSEVKILRVWDDLKVSLDLTPYSFELHECVGVFHYISN